LYVENLYDFSRNLKVLDLFTMWICQQKKLDEEYEIVDTLNFRVSFRHDFYIQKSKFQFSKYIKILPIVWINMMINLPSIKTTARIITANVISTKHSWSTDIFTVQI